uniref:Uncharacterized protein n=1 Tax=Arundo donax TaxID=35708 RepID=A0A0A9BDK7_ARUDO
MQSSRSEPAACLASWELARSICSAAAEK